MVKVLPVGARYTNARSPVSDTKTAGVVKKYFYFLEALEAFAAFGAASAPGVTAPEGAGTVPGALVPGALASPVLVAALAAFATLAEAALAALALAGAGGAGFLAAAGAGLAGGASSSPPQAMKERELKAAKVTASVVSRIMGVSSQTFGYYLTR
ncbi:MAG: hypothetical protein ACPGTU_11745 [Myxococcota bacterium]